MPKRRDVSLEGAVVVVTGAGSGIGRELSVGFAGDGARVVGFARTGKDLAETASRCGDGEFLAIPGDVTSDADVERLVDETLAKHGRIDVLVNCAGVHERTKFSEVPLEKWTRTVEVNLVGAARCMLRALPVMLRQGRGRIVNVSSIAARFPFPLGSAYAASKAGLEGLTRTVAAEVKRDGHRDVLINAWSPGRTRTRMTPHGQDPARTYRYARQLAVLPAGGPTGLAFRRGRPQEGPAFRTRVVLRRWRRSLRRLRQR